MEGWLNNAALFCPTKIVSSFMIVSVILISAHSIHIYTHSIHIYTHNIHINAHSIQINAHNIHIYTHSIYGAQNRETLKFT